MNCHIVNGISYTCGEICDIIRPEGAETLGVYGDDFYQGTPCVTKHVYGQGTAYYIGTSPEFSFVKTMISALCKEKIPPKMTFGTNLLENFRALSERINIPRVMFNSLLVAVIFTVLSIIVYSMAGYALAKYQFKGKKIVFLLVMLTMMLPAQVTYIPRYMLMTKLGGVDQYWSVIIPPLANAFGIFLMRQNMYSIPNALIEAARLDGCNEYTTFIRIVIPNIKPAISALGIYTICAVSAKKLIGVSGRPHRPIII